MQETEGLMETVIEEDSWMIAGSVGGGISVAIERPARNGQTCNTRKLNEMNNAPLERYQYQQRHAQDGRYA
jgi:hypothetical protein